MLKKAKHQRLTLLDVASIRGTIIPRLMHSSLAWLTICIYALIRALYSTFKFDSHISLTQLTALTTFVSFLLVFVNTTLFQRFFAVYTQAMTVQERIFDIMTMGQSFLSLSPEIGWRLLRYVNAAHILAYVGLHGGKVYDKDNFLTEMVKKHQLLTEDEIARIDEIDVTLGGAAYREVLTWATEEIKEYLTLHRPNLPATDNYRVMITIISAIRSSITALYEYADQPIPFIYIHMVNLTVVLYLPLFACCVATAIPQASASDEVLGALIVLTTVVIIVGIRLVGDAILDPFGPEIEDLSVLRNVTFTLTASRRIYLANNPTKKRATTLEEELQMEALRPDAGAAWRVRGGGLCSSTNLKESAQGSTQGEDKCVQAASPEFLAIEFAASAAREASLERLSSIHPSQQGEKMVKSASKLKNESHSGSFGLLPTTYVAATPPRDFVDLEAALAHDETTR